MTQRIGIFGGSFNPIHSGHLRIALKAIDDWGLDMVLVVPAARNPFKDPAERNFSYDAKWHLVRYACMPHPKLVPCDIELRRGGTSYAIDTVREVRRRFPDSELFFIVGEDSVPGLPRWREADELAKLVKFVSYPRTRESSTEIRRRIENGEPISDLAPQVVEDIVSARGVVFDFGGVICHSPFNPSWPLYPYMAGFGVSREEVNKAFMAHRLEWDGGACQYDGYCRRVFADLSLPPPTGAQVADLWRVDAEQWAARPNADTLAFMRVLKDAGRKVGILTNMSREFYERIFTSRCADYCALADAVVVSGIDKVAKPFANAYALVAEKMGLEPRDMLFIDDTEPNVAAASALGWRSARQRELPDWASGCEEI